MRRRPKHLLTLGQVFRLRLLHLVQVLWLRLQNLLNSSQVLRLRLQHLLNLGQVLRLRLQHVVEVLITVKFSMICLVSLHSKKWYKVIYLVIFQEKLGKQPMHILNLHNWILAEKWLKILYKNFVCSIRTTQCTHLQKSIAD